MQCLYQNYWTTMQAGGKSCTHTSSCTDVAGNCSLSLYLGISGRNQPYLFYMGMSVFMLHCMCLYKIEYCILKRIIGSYLFAKFILFTQLHKIANRTALHVNSEVVYVYVLL